MIFRHNRHIQIVDPSCYKTNISFLVTGLSRSHKHSVLNIYPVDWWVHLVLAFSLMKGKGISARNFIIRVFALVCYF